MLADIHGGGNFHHWRIVLLGGIERGGKLRHAEHIRHAVVADAVAAAKILVRVVIRHAPTDRAAGAAAAVGRVQHAGVAQRMLHTDLLAVKALGWIHVPVMFRDEIRRIWPCHKQGQVQRDLAAGMDKVVVGIHILQQMALREVAHTARLTSIVQ